MTRTKLEPRYVDQVSFYGKAKTETNGDEITLYSYNTEILTIIPGDRVCNISWFGYSKTTMNHINDFLQQNSLPKLYKKDWLFICDWYIEYELPLLKEELEYIIENPKEAKEDMQRATGQFS